MVMYCCNISQHVSVCAGDAAGSRQDANRLYDPDLYHLSSQQSTQLSSRLMDLVYSNPWHPLARKHLTTASVHTARQRVVRHCSSVRSCTCGIPVKPQRLAAASVCCVALICIGHFCAYSLRFNSRDAA